MIHKCSIHIHKNKLLQNSNSQIHDLIYIHKMKFGNPQKYFENLVEYLQNIIHKCSIHIHKKQVYIFANINS